MGEADGLKASILEALLLNDSPMAKLFLPEQSIAAASSQQTPRIPKIMVESKETLISDPAPASSESIRPAAVTVEAVVGDSAATARPSSAEEAAVSKPPINSELASPKADTDNNNKGKQFKFVAPLPVSKVSIRGHSPRNTSVVAADVGSSSVSTPVHHHPAATDDERAIWYRDMNAHLEHRHSLVAGAGRSMRAQSVQLKTDRPRSPNRSLAGSSNNTNTDRDSETTSLSSASVPPVVRSIPFATRVFDSFINAKF